MAVDETAPVAARALRGGRRCRVRCSVRFVPDPCAMLDWIDPNPGGALIKIVGAIAIVGLAIAVWFQLTARSRRTAAACWRGSRSGWGSRCCSCARARACSRSSSASSCSSRCSCPSTGPRSSCATRAGRARSGTRSTRAASSASSSRSGAGRGRRAPTPRSRLAWRACRVRDAGDARLPLARAPDAVLRPRRPGAGCGPCTARRAADAVLAGVAPRAAGLGALARASCPRRGTRGVSRRDRRR